MATARNQSLPPLKVRYPRRMKTGRTYSVQVEWQRTPPRLGEDAPNMTVRLVMPGAQVVPGERPMNPNRPREKAVFYVTPVTKGWLRGERLEVVADGEKVQEIRLPSKAVGRAGPWVFLLLAVLVPWFLTTFIQTRPFRPHVKGLAPYERHLEAYTPLKWVKNQSVEQLNSMGVEKRSVRQGWNEVRNLYNFGFWTLQSDELRLAKDKKQKEVDKDEEQPVAGGAGPPGGGGGGVAPAPKPVDPNALARDPGPEDGTSMNADNVVKLHLPFYSAVFFLFLAVISWWFHRDKMRRRTGQPIKMSYTDGA